MGVVASTKDAESVGVDYAAAADEMIDGNEDDGDSESDVSEGKKKTAADSSDDDDSDDDGESSSSEAESNEEELNLTSESNRIASSLKGDGEEPCSFDLRNLLATNSHTVDTATLYRPSLKDPDTSSTIPPAMRMNEEFLLKKAQEGCHQLLQALWKLPQQESSDVGTLVTLPTYEESRLPRSLVRMIGFVCNQNNEITHSVSIQPLPPPRVETKWEKFAKAKGIGVNQSKRSRKVWDEATGEWKYRTGYQKANDSSKSWPILEADPNDPYTDPWQKEKDEKKARVTSNTKQRLQNMERSGSVAKGTSKRLLAGVPVDLQPGGKKSNADVTAAPRTDSKQRGQASTLAALRATQHSTASLGKFDRMREGEPERKKSNVKPKRKSNGPTDEHARSLQVLKSMSKGGDEKARKQGRLATGETAYDYDFDDGLGPSTFRKRKGRAGAGKMKKMTKKRVK